MKLKNSVKLTVLSLSLAALAVTSCGGKSGGTDNNIILANKDIDAQIEMRSSPELLSKEIEKITAMTDEDAKLHCLQMINNSINYMNLASAEDLKEKYLKELKEKLKIAKVESDKQKKQKEIDEVTNQQADVLKLKLKKAAEETKQELILLQPATAKQKSLEGLKALLKLLQENNPPSSPAEDKPAPAEDKPAAPVEDKPAAPVEDKPLPLEDKPVEDKPVEDKPAEDKPAEDKPAPVEDKEP